MEFLYEARKWATDRGFDLPISNFLPHLGSIDNEDFNDTRPNAIHASPHRSEKRPEHSSPHGRLPSSLHGRAPTLSLSSPVPPMPPHSPTTTSKSTSRVSVNHPSSTRTPPHSGSSRVESHSTQHQQDMDFEMRRKIEFNNANAMRSMNNNNNSINNSSSSSIMYSTMDVDSGGVSLNRQGIDALASHSHSGEPLSSSRSSSSSSVPGPSQAELLNSARQRALAAEQRCIELESVVENYARQGAGLEALAKDLNQTVNQQIVDVTEEAREAKMRAFKAESELNGANEQLIKTLSELEEMKKVIRNVQAEADEAKAETEAMRRRAESQIEEIKRAVTDHAEQISTEAQAAVYQAKRAMDEAIREAERVREREAAAKADASTAQSRIATLLEDFEIMRMEAQALKSSSQTSESQLAEAREEIERLRSRLLKVETQAAAAAAAATASTTVRATPSSDNNHYQQQQQHNLSIESSSSSSYSSETRGNDSSSYSNSLMSSKQESLSDHSDHATKTLTSSVTNSVTRKDNQTNSSSTSSASPSSSSLSSVRQVVVHITDPDAPSLLPRPQHSRGANTAKGTKDAGATLSVLNRNEVMVMDGEDSMSFSAHVVAGGHLAKGGEHAANLNRMLSSISESVVNGGRSSAIFLGSAPSLGDAPFQSLSSAASAALFNVIEKSNEREGGVVQRSVGVGLVEVGPATTTLKHSTNKAPNDGLEDEVRDILDAYSSKGASADGEYNVVGSIDDARLVAPVISPYLGSDDDDLSPTSSSLSPIVSRAASVVVTGSEGVDVVVELALRNRANIRAFGTPESASTIEAALLLMRTHAVLTLSVTHSTLGEEEGSFVSRLHIVHLACPGHIGAIEQINATPPLLPRALYQGAMAESNRASKTLSALASAWNALESASSRSGGNNHDDLAGRLEIDTFVNNCVLTNVISDALQPASPLLFLVEIPPILNRFADLDAAVSFLSTASDVTKGLSKGGRNNLAVLALETQLQQNRLLNRYLSAQAQPQPSSIIVNPASSNPAPARRHSTVNTPVVSTNNSSNPQRDFVRSGTGTGGGGLHAVWDPIIRRPSTSSLRRKSQSAVDDVSMQTQINSFTTPKAANRSSSSSSSSTKLTSFGSSTASISSHRNTLSGAGATPYRDPSSRVTQKKPAVPRLSGAASHTYRQASSIAPSGHSETMTTSTPRFDDIDAAIEQELMDATAMRLALLREKQFGQTQPLHSSIAKKQNNSSVSAGQGQQQQQPLLYNNAKQTEDLYVNDEPDPVPGMRAILQIASESGGLRPSSFDTLRAMLSSSDVYGYGKVTPRAFAQGLSRWLPNLGIERATGIVASMGIVDEGGDDSNVKEDGVDYEDFVTAVQSLWEQSSM